jgi:hypothetical protein
MPSSSASRNTVFIVAVCIGATSFAAGESHIWTSSDGRTVEAEFIRLDGETVEIKTADGVFRLPLAKLSEADQAYAREQAATTERMRPMKIEVREWSIGGEQIKARFARLRDGNVQLVRGRQVVSHSILLLSREDVAYVYAVLESRGELEKLKDDLSVQVLVAKETGHRTDEQFVRERQQMFARTEPPAASPPSVPTEDIAPPTPQESLAAESPRPLESSETAPNEDGTAIAQVAADAVAEKVAMPLQPPMPAPVVMPPPPNVPPEATRSGIHSDDPWERDQAIMEASNRAAYYWMAGVLALLVTFGPILYVLQRFRG